MRNVQNRRYYGFIRTQSFSKAIEMFPNIQCLRLERAVRRETTRTQHKGYIKRDREVKDIYVVDWRDRPVMAQEELDTLAEVIRVGKIGDFKIDKVTCGFECPEIVRYLNELVAETCQGKEVMEIPAREKLLATFTSCWDDEFKRLDYLAELNRVETEQYGFKLGVLDLTDIHTARVEKYGEVENIDVHDDPKFIRRIMKCLNWDGWKAEARMVEVDNVSQVARPCAIRGYELKDKHNWVLETQEEVNG